MSHSPNRSGEYNPWAVGLALFAGAVMMTVGLFQAFQGLVALLDDTFDVVRENYTFEFDVTTWGWIHLILGVLLAIVGYALVRGSTWAKAVGIFLVSLSALANFLWIPYYPVWSVLLIALDVAVIWALCVYAPQRA
jgi:hypothetical protein